MDLCSWIADKGGPTALTIEDVMDIIDTFLGFPPPDITFTVTIENVFGVIDYYLGFDGDPLTGCDFF